MAKTIFEEMGGTYVRQGDYDLPCLSLPAEKENKPICLVHNKNTQNCRGASSKLQREFPQ